MPEQKHEQKVWTKPSWHNKKVGNRSLKTALKSAIQTTAEVTGDLVGNRRRKRLQRLLQRVIKGYIHTIRKETGNFWWTLSIIIKNMCREKMEYQKMIHFLDNHNNQSSKFITKTRVEVNDDARGTCNTKLKSNLRTLCWSQFPVTTKMHSYFWK